MTNPNSYAPYQTYATRDDMISQEFEPIMDSYPEVFGLPMVEYRRFGNSLWAYLREAGMIEWAETGNLSFDGWGWVTDLDTETAFWETFGALLGELDTNG